MNATETVDALRRLATVIERHAENKKLNFPRNEAALDEAGAHGAAFMVCLLRDLIQASPVETWGKPRLLVMLETISCDPEIFPLGIGKLVWAMEVEDEG